MADWFRTVFFYNSFSEVQINHNEIRAWSFLTGTGVHNKVGFAVSGRNHGRGTTHGQFRLARVAERRTYLIYNKNHRCPTSNLGRMLKFRPGSDSNTVHGSLCKISNRGVLHGHRTWTDATSKRRSIQSSIY